MKDLIWQPYFDDSSASTLFFSSTAFYHCQPVQPKPVWSDRQAGRQVYRSPPCHSRCPPHSEGWREPGGYSKREWTTEGLCRWGLKTNQKKCYPSAIFFTFLVHCLTVLTSSDMTMSTHLVQGSLIFPICLFTMVSKAMSGVKRPVLPGRERTSHRAKQKKKEEDGGEKKKEGGGLGKKKSC